MARGYNQWDDVAPYLENVSGGNQLGVNLANMWTLFQQQITLLNDLRSPLIRFLTFPATEPVESVIAANTERFELATEFGVPKGVRTPRPAPLRYGYDFNWFDLASRYTWKMLLDASPAYLQSIQDTVLSADIENQFTYLFRAVFNSATRTAIVDGEASPINVYPFYNADGMVPPQYRTTTFAGSHTHYLTTAHPAGGAGPDSADIESMATHLQHHGFRMELGYRLVLMVNPQEAAIISTFKRGTDSQPDATAVALPRWDFIPIGPAWYGGGIRLTEAENQPVIGAPPSAALEGLNEIGTYGPFHVVEDELMPVGYMFAFATGGEVALTNPIGIREHRNPRGRGLQLLDGPDREYPIRESYYTHGFGTGVRNRGAGVVMQVLATSSTYVVPAAYLF
jgi:hypothetical protein